MKERFAQLIDELGTLLSMDLFLDANDSCDLLLEETLSIQLEQNDQEQVVIGCFLGELQAGRYREDVLHNALKENYLSHAGVFAYNEPNNQLTFFSLLPIRDLTAIFLQGSLAEFSEVALSWHDALKKGEALPLTKSTSLPLQNPFLNP